MKKLKDGGPAFPHHETGDAVTRPGMTLRDWFAGQALAGMCSLDDNGITQSWVVAFAAARAYSLADAMLAAREGDAS